MLSTLQRFYIVDEHNHRTRLNDLSVELLKGDYPPVTQIFYSLGKQGYELDWGEVRAVDRDKREITVSDLKSGKKISNNATTKDVLLMRDVLDALVLDLQNRRATRANDLLLEEENGQLFLRAADVSFRALLRRLTKGLLGGEKSEEIYDWKYVEFLRGNPKAVKDGAGYQLRITRLPAGVIAQLSTSIPYIHAAELVILLPDQLAKETLEIMLPERQLQVFEELDEEQALKLLALLSPDIAADIIGRINLKDARSYLNKLPRPQAERILELLKYPEDSAGGIMTNDVVFIRADLSVKEAREVLRKRVKKPDFAYFIYVVDNDRSKRLQGIISLREIVAEEEDSLIKEFMNPYTDTINPYESAYKAAIKVIDSSLAALPVVGKEGELLGVITVDVAIDRAAPTLGAQTPRVFT